MAIVDRPTVRSHPFQQMCRVDWAGIVVTWAIDLWKCRYDLELVSTPIGHKCVRRLSKNGTGLCVQAAPSLSPPPKLL